MWFLISILIVLWIIGYMTFGSRAYWVDGLLVIGVAFYILNKIRGKRSSA